MKNQNIFILLWIMGVLWTSMSMAYVGASTTDISFLLPGGGHFDNESCNARWGTYFPYSNYTGPVYYSNNTVTFYENAPDTLCVSEM